MIVEQSQALPQNDVIARDTVLSAMSEGVLVFNADGDVVYANPAAHALLGRNTIRVDAASTRALRDALIEPEEWSRRAEPGFRATKQLELPDRVVEAVSSGAPPGNIVVVVRDITGVRGTDRLRRDFVANASHELKTPVASILALSETMRTAARNPESMDRLLSRLEQEAGRLARLVGDLLELSRLEGGEPLNTRVPLRHAIVAEVNRVRHQAESHGLDLQLQSKLPDLVVTGSEGDLALLVHNLLDNAIRYTPRGGAIRVALRRDRGVAAFTVADSGIGIPEADLSRVFERFYRVDSARSRQTGGTGLGLSIVRNIAQAHGGDVDVVSRPGDGSTFRVRLPLARSQPGSAGQVRRGSDTRDHER